MPSGQLRDYYWRIVACLAGCWEFLDARHPAFQFPSDDEVEHTGAPHHPGISTHPHQLHPGAKPKRGPERLCPTDIPRVDFIAVVEKIIEQIERSE